MDRSILEQKALAELREIASALDLRGYQRMKKADLVDLIVGAGEASPNGNGSASTPEPATEPSDTSPDAEVSDGDRDDRDDRDDRGRADVADESEDDRQARADDENEDGDDDDRNRARNKQRRRKNRSGGGPGEPEEAEVREGVLDLLPEGYGFLRTTGYLSGPRDVYVSQSFVRRFNLRRGDRVRGPIRANNRGNDKFPALARVDAIEGLTVDEHMNRRRPDFRDLTAVHPCRRLGLDGDATSPVLRLVDVAAPLGHGQRALVIAPPHAGATTLLRDLARTIAANHPDVHVMVLLVDERPEEVTDFVRSTSAEVVSSTFDRPADDHTQIAELALERAKRLVERGTDVVILLDSLTRLTRSYGLVSGTHRSGSVGIDPAALYPVKRLLGAARNVEDGGSLTIVATVQDTPVDAAAIADLEGTATTLVRIQRGPAPQGLFPLVDVLTSGTRHDDLLHDDDERAGAAALRRVMSSMDPAEAADRLAERLASTDDNAAFLRAVTKDGLA